MLVHAPRVEGPVVLTHDADASVRGRTPRDAGFDAHNPTTDAFVANVLALRDQASRERAGRFFMEGTRFVFRALRQNVRVDTVLTCPELHRGPASPRLVARIHQQGVPVVELSRPQFERLSLAGSPRGVGAIGRLAWTSLRDVRPTAGRPWIAVQHVRSPGNLGSLLRTCDAVGAAGLICTGRDVDPYAPSVLRATMGSLFELTLVRTSIKRLRSWADEHDVFLVGATGDGEFEYDAVRYPPRTVIVLGEERKGLSRRARGSCDLLTRIPMCGSTDSLNLAVAGSLILYEEYRQRRSSEQHSHG